MIGFGKYTKKAEATTITSLTDNRMVKIDPQESGFFDTVLNFKSTNKEINRFIEAVEEVKEASLEAFYRVKYDPTEIGDHMIAFQNGKKPAIGHSYNWWVVKQHQRCLQLKVDSGTLQLSISTMLS